MESKAWAVLPFAMGAVIGIGLGALLWMGLMTAGIVQPASSWGNYDEPNATPAYMVRLTPDPALPRTYLWDINELAKLRSEWKYVQVDDLSLFWF